MVPSQRPVLHYVLDRPGAPERTMTLRPDSYDWPIVGPAQRDIALQWIAPDPVAYATTQNSLAFVVAPAVVALHSPGDVGVRPVVQIVGPITGASCSLNAAPGVGVTNFRLTFLSAYTIAAGVTVTIDCAARTVVDSSGASLLAQMDWTRTFWPTLPVNPLYTNINYSGTATTGATAVTALWYDGFLT
jgi:hypothetical protein